MSSCWYTAQGTLQCDKNDGQSQTMIETFAPDANPVQYKQDNTYNYAAPNKKRYPDVNVTYYNYGSQIPDEQRVEKCKTRCSQNKKCIGFTDRKMQGNVGQCLMITNDTPKPSWTNAKNLLSWVDQPGSLYYKQGTGYETTSITTPLPINIDSVPGWYGGATFEETSADFSDNNQTAESCRHKAIASRGKYVAWGFRNANHPEPGKNTCFLYTKPFAPFAGDPTNKMHQTGCLRPGEKVEYGCTKPPTAKLPKGIDVVPGFIGAPEDIEGTNENPETCRQKALASKGKYVAWGFRDATHFEPRYRNTCFMYKAPFAPFEGNASITGHTTGCVNPGEKVKYGCKPPPVVKPVVPAATKPAVAPATKTVTPPSVNVATVPTTSCYGARAGECKTCDDVVNAYKARNWRYNTNDFEQCKKPVAAPPQPVAPVQKDAIKSSSCIKNTCLVSKNNNYKMCQQNDGHLVMYKANGKVLWASGIAPGPGGELCMQDDGNLVNYMNGKPYWNTNTHSDKPVGPYTAVMQDDGNFVIYQADGKPTWHTNTYGL